MTFEDDPAGGEQPAAPKDPAPRQATRGLGRGLSALLGEEPGANERAMDRGRGLRQVPVAYLRPGRYQPRQAFDADELDTLVQSINRQGVLQPLIVRQLPEAETGGEETYEIVAGERRWRAAQLAQLHEVPVIVRQLNDTEALQIALIENIQRQDLNPMEEAEGYQRLMNEFGHSPAEIGEAVGKSRSHVANAVRLMSLPDDVKSYVRSGELTAGAARAVITAEDPAGLAREVVERGLNVRDVEAIRRQVKQQVSDPRPAPTRRKDPDTLALEQSLADALGLKVDVRHKGGKGEVRISYRTLEQLDEICQRLTRT
ncbi:MAG: ParB/RepB/Spo0J family partition protein [Minwuia sp.]|nr:ParB/RepB/Spo0J family partition protein [Minwuia sp.]